MSCIYGYMPHFVTVTFYDGRTHSELSFHGEAVTAKIRAANDNDFGQ
jgi:hypothetical protein